MANLEHLLQAISDSELKAQIKAEVSALKSRTRFGLVFERHLPETVIVRDTDCLRVGDQVRLRQDAANGQDYRVVGVADGRTTILSSKTGAEANAKLDELLVVKRFGDPVYLSLAPLESVRRSDDRPYHAVIDGENFHALQLLTFALEGQVDCIYIDPPYNTGARDWKYNNRFVDDSDAWRHSKWLAFMEKRLYLAKRLLKPDGVLIVTIDENEVHHLGMLLEELFPEYLRYMVTIVVSAQGNAKVNFSRVDEYAIFCVPNTGYDVIEGAPIEFLPEHDDLDVVEDDEEQEEEELLRDHYVSAEEAGSSFVSENARRRGTESLRQNRPKMFYPIYIDDEVPEVVRAGPPIEIDEKPDFSRVDGLRPVWPIDGNGDERRWRWGYETMIRLIEAGEIQVGKYSKRLDAWTINRVQAKNSEFRKLKSVWRHTSHSAGTHGSGLLGKFLGRGVSFAFPKSVYATRDCLAAVCRSRPDAVIVDFFAGSGTTLHSTLLMNAADGGRRRCILVTNNEVEEKTATHLKKKGIYPGAPGFEAEGVFEAVARPRCRAAITGLRPDGKPVIGSYLDGRPFDKGFEENVEFFRLDYLDSEQVELGHCFDAIHPLLWFVAGGLGQRPETSAEQSFVIVPESRYAVLFRDDAFRDFEDALTQHDAITHVFLVTDSEEAFADMRERVGAGRQIVMLYGDLLRHYRRRGRL